MSEFYVDTFSLEGGTGLRLHGSLSSLTADAFEERLDALDLLHAAGSVVLDCADLAYVSSAGLRIFIRLQKRVPKKLMLVNVQAPVFEVLSMSGFTELMQVMREPEEVSVEGCEVVGRGASGVVYRLDEDTIVKLYPAGYPITDLVREREASRTAFIQGIPTSIPFGMVRAGERVGLAYEMVKAQSLQTLLVEHPENVADYMRSFVGLFRTFHEVHDTAHEFPSIRETYLGLLSTCDRWYDRQVIEELAGVAHAIPEGDVLLHGDFHPGNIMVGEDGEMCVLDLGEMGHGHPVWDLMGFAMHYPCLTRHEGSRGLCERLHGGLSAQMHDRVWDEFVAGYYADRTPAERARLDDLAEVATACWEAVSPARMANAPEEMTMAAVNNFLAKWRESRNTLLALTDFDQFV